MDASNSLHLIALSCATASFAAGDRACFRGEVLSGSLRGLSGVGAFVLAMLVGLEAGGTANVQADVPPAAATLLSADYTDVKLLDILEKIAECESGGDPRAFSPRGQYRGKYQFDRPTWASVGGTGDPAAASEAEQDMRAILLLAMRGTQPWPVCGAAGKASTILAGEKGTDP